MPLKDNDFLTIFSAVLLASCGSFDGANAEKASPTRAETIPPAPVQEPVKIGNEYKAFGQSYTPSDQANYDEVGYASWYGAELAGKATGNGERFDPAGITGAHRTLPMPSFVEVTNLDTGRTILVRINDRGPFSNDRIIDLSEGAAKQLGVAGQGHFPVRVRRVNPPEHERVALKNGQSAAERLETPPALLNALRKKLGVAMAKPAPAETAAQAAAPVQKSSKTAIVKPAPAKENPKPVPAPKPAPTATVASQFYVQVGAFSTEARAKTAAAQVGGSVTPAGKFWRVRTGPYSSEAAAKAALGPAAAKGYRDARITR